MNALTGKTPPWRWPIEWYHDHTFWREVASRTLAAVFAAAIIFVFAVIAGYISGPDVLPLAIAGTAAGVVVSAIALVAGIVSTERRASNRRLRNRFIAAFVFCLLAFFLVVWAHAAGM